MHSFGRSGSHRTPSFTMNTHLGPKSDMERDSGFSDASSGYQSAVDLTDTEESGRRGTGLNQDPAAQPVALMGGSYAGVSPMIIMNNFLLNQSSNMNATDKQWGLSTPMEVMPQSQVVLLQPMLPNSGNSTPKAGHEKGRQSKAYTPFKSYPKIAPHPGEHLQKRVGSSRQRGSSEYEPRQKKHHHSRRGYNAVSPKPAQQTSASHSHSFETVNNQIQVSEAQLCEKPPTPQTGGLKGLFSSVPTYTHDFQTDSDISVCSDKDTSGSDSNKQKRFSNTYNILSQSGLLGITMRTKQLIKENRRTQSQLQQLREQTALLLEALSSGDGQLWTKLQLSLQDTEKEAVPVKSPPARLL